MYYNKLKCLKSQFSELQKEIQAIDNYLGNLSINKAQRLMPGMISNTLNLDYEKVYSVLIKAQDLKIVTVNYEIFCPETQNYIKRIELLPEKSEYEIEDCKYCDENHTIHQDEIQISFRLLEESEGKNNTSLLSSKINYIKKFFTERFSKKKPYQELLIAHFKNT
jgi:hypothetical protein